MRIANMLIAGFVSWLGLCSTAVAADRTFGDWSVALLDDASAVYASTVNDSGEVLGEYCYFSDGNCLWLLGMETSCKDGDPYPLLANSSSGASHLTVRCFGALDDGKTHLYVFDWEEIESVIKGAKWVGLAFPMDGDRFKVVRFSLNGIDGSTRFLETAFRQGMDASNGRAQGTRTQIM